MTTVYYIVVISIAFLIFYVLKKKSIWFFDLAENSFRLLNDLLSKEEDEKIGLIQNRTRTLLYNLFKLIGLFLFLSCISFLLLYVFILFNLKDYQNLDLSSIYFIIAVSFGATLPFIFNKKKQDSGYSKIAQLFHRLILDNYNISEKLFEIDVKSLRKKDVGTRSEFIIISGLARAGTTSLMTKLSKIKNFKSLNYGNMPLVMSPGIWKKFYRPKNKKSKERSHKDGISIGLDSVEALEEYFFKVKMKDSFIDKVAILEHELSDKIYNDYLLYQQIIREEEEKIYLAKNNNFLLRYSWMRKMNSDFTMVIMFRDPLSHSHSLLEQHIRFSKLQETDPFVLEYMNWLGHHEFGKGHKQFIFTNRELEISGDKTKIDFWLKIWINYYSFVIDLDQEGILLISYDEYCKKPKKIIDEIILYTGNKIDSEETSGYKNNRLCNESFNQEIFNQAQSIYVKLLSKKDK